MIGEPDRYRHVPHSRLAEPELRNWCVSVLEVIAGKDYRRGLQLTCTNIPHWVFLLVLLAWPAAAILIYSHLWSRYMPDYIGRRDHWGGYGAIIVLLASGITFLLFLTTCLPI